MVRVKRGFVARHRRKKVLKRAKGFRGSLKRLFRTSKQVVIRSMDYATRHRRKRKGDMRALWITRINAAVRQFGSTYGRFMSDLKKAGIQIDRKILADFAVKHPEVLKRLAESSKAAKK